MHTHSGRERKEWLTQGNMGVEDSERGRNAERTGEAQETGRAEEAEDGVVVVGGGGQGHSCDKKKRGQNERCSSRTVRKINILLKIVWSPVHPSLLLL